MMKIKLLLNNNNKTNKYVILFYQMRKNKIQFLMKIQYKQNNKCNKWINNQITNQFIHKKASKG